MKEIIFDSKLNLPTGPDGTVGAGGEVELDTAITPELKEEGILRELVRAVQDLRQAARFRPQDKIMFMIDVPIGLRDIVIKNEIVFKKEIGAKQIEYKKSEKFDAEINTKIDNQAIWLGVRKI